MQLPTRALLTSAACLCTAVLALADAPPATGRVVYEGPRPEPKALPSTAEQTKGCCPEGREVDVADPSLIVDDKGGLKNVVVMVDVPGAPLVLPKEPVVVDQRQCAFDPHVLIVPAGATVRFLNSDGVPHNVRAFSAKNDSFNKVMAPGGKEDVVLAKADKVRIQCDYHPWMSTWLYVTDTPFHALTRADGTFAIRGLPAGTWKVKVWHEALGRGEAMLTVREDGTSDPLEIKLAPKKKKQS